MCNRYIAPNDLDIERFWHLGPRTKQLPTWLAGMAPLRPGPFIKAGGELEVGQWGMIPPRSATRIPMTKGSATQKPRRMSTNNARRETVASAWTFKDAWAKGRRCLIPAWNYIEPYWGIANKNIWWQFARTDGVPWALAGIWDEWADLDTGEVVPSYSMLTQNVDAHPLLRLMHRPEMDKAGQPLPADKQDKRAVVPLEKDDWDTWLHGTVEQAASLIQIPSLEVFAHGPEEPGKRVRLDLETGEGLLLTAGDELFRRGLDNGRQVFAIRL